jgi:hypothetical protein
MRLSLLAAALLAGVAVHPAARAADVDAATLALATLGGGMLTLHARYPDVLEEIDDQEADYSERSMLDEVGGAAFGLRNANAPEADRIAANAFLGRIYLLNLHFDIGRKTLEEVLADAARLKWPDARINGTLRDLAWVTAATGDNAASARYGARAEACAAPCADDIIPALLDRAKTAREQVIEALGNDVGYRRLSDTEGENSVAFAEAVFGPNSDEARDAWMGRAVAAEEDRPWKALDYYQRMIQIDAASGAPMESQLSTRSTIAELLLNAGEYERLVPYADALLADAEKVVADNRDGTNYTDNVTSAARLKARALWHLRDPRAREAFGRAIEVTENSGNYAATHVLLEDLLDARYEDEILALAQTIIRETPGDEGARLAKARVFAWMGDYGGAATVLDQIEDPSPVDELQRAIYLEKAGLAKDARVIRTSLSIVPPAANQIWSSWSAISPLIDARDYGAYEAAAEATRAYLPLAETFIKNATYEDAQVLWQLAFTLALGGETVNSFRLMHEAASIAARLSFAHANDTDGGSLQLLRRDKFRYLLFVDIAWAAATGAPPESMSVSSRY